MRGEHARAAGQDLAERVGEGWTAAAACRQVGEVAGVARVAVVPLLDRAAVAGFHLTVQRGAVGRRGEDQRNRARELVEQAASLPACVSLQAEGVRGRALLTRERDVCGGERRPARFQLDPGRVAVEAGR